MAQVYIDPGEWNRAASQIRDFDKKLYSEMRKRIRNAGRIAEDKVEEALAESPPSGGDSSVGSRAALIAGTRTSLSFAAKTAGVKITTSGSRLGAGHAGFEKAYNKPSFRHPVHGNRNAWASQQGRPYFGKVIGQALNKEILDEIQAAIDDALEAIADGV